MKRVKVNIVFSVAVMIVSILAFFLLCDLLQNELEDHWKLFVSTGSHAAYYTAVFSNPKVLGCLIIVLGTEIAAISENVKAIRREERGSLVLLILVCLALAVFAVLFWLLLKAL